MKKKRISLLNILVFILAFIISSAIFSDWDNFKMGLKGELEVQKEQQHDKR
ncbi:hypothetical protein KI659_06935 [Litoribacter alkaliphilus]|uniref:Uncharacterized protein n=1 Tax=Litoribacter ruber TaxID=702568 RepID=A0AAP2CKZ6_9BACT|nr:hypothetical protein [Litoribacter alkaliphilus]MBS9523752.1 hypothetical protein [Litoribacter alkaliphilus]